MDLNLLLVAAIASVPPTIAALAALVQAVRTHQAVNSRMTELLELARKEASSQATLDEKAAEHARKGDAAIGIVQQIANDNHPT